MGGGTQTNDVNAMLADMQRQRANDTLIRTGGAMMASQSPYFLQQVGQGFQAGAQRTGNPLQDALLATQLSKYQTDKARQERQEKLYAGILSPKATGDAISADPVGDETVTPPAYPMGMNQQTASILQAMGPQAGLPFMLSQMVPKTADPYTLSPGQTRFGPDGKPIAALPVKPDAQPSALREYAYSKSQGYQGTFTDWKRENAQAGRPQNIGSIPPGHQLDYDKQGNIIGMSPMAGSPAASKVAAEKKAQESASVSSAVKAETMLAATSDIRKEIREARTPVTGTSSLPFALYSGSAAGRVRSYVGTLKSGVVLGAMQKLKEASSTGATGFGAMNQSELQILIDDIGALNPDTTEEDIFLKTINRIEDRYKRVIVDVQKNVSPERQRELGLDKLIAGIGGDDKPKKSPSVDDLLKKYGQ